MNERLCGNDLHEMTPENTTNFGRCRACKRAYKATAAANGNTPEHEVRLKGEARCERRHPDTPRDVNEAGRCLACKRAHTRAYRATAAVNSRNTPEYLRLTGEARCERRHPSTPRVVNEAGRCRRCRQLGVYRGIAERSGAGLCENGHGLVYGGVSPSGECTECTAAPQPTAATWLDWAAVYQALQGRPLVRPLTHNEMLCALTTLRRRNSWGRTEACDWMRDNTAIPVPDDNLEWVELVWARQHGLPALTVNEAITHGYEDYDEAEVVAA